jgi:hypothetical protein
MSDLIGPPILTKRYKTLAEVIDWLKSARNVVTYVCAQTTLPMSAEARELGFTGAAVIITYETPTTVGSITVTYNNRYRGGCWGSAHAHKHAMYTETLHPQVLESLLAQSYGLTTAAETLVPDHNANSAVVGVILDNINSRNRIPHVYLCAECYVIYREKYATYSLYRTLYKEDTWALTRKCHHCANTLLAVLNS